MNPQSISGIKRVNELTKRIEDICGGPAAPTARQSRTQQLRAIADVADELDEGVKAHRAIEDLLTCGAPRPTVEVASENMACLLRLINARMERDLETLRALVRDVDDDQAARD